MADGINQNIAILSLMAALKDNSKEITRDVEKLVTKVENNAGEIHFKGNTEEVQDSIKEIVDLLNNKLKGVNTTKYLQPILEVFSDSTKSAQEYKKAVDDVKTSIGELASISSDKGAKAALPFLNQRDIDKAISIQKKVEEKQIASAKKISVAQEKANKVEHLSLQKLRKEYEKNEKYTSSISDNRVSEFASKMGIKSSTATVKNEVKEYSELLSLFELLHNKKKEMGEISTAEDALENIKITKTLLFLQGKIADKQQTLKSKYKADDISIGIPEDYSSINAYNEFGSIDQYVSIIKKQANEAVLKAKKELNDYIIERAEKHKAAADKEFDSSVEKTKKKYANVGTTKNAKEGTEPVENLGQTAKGATENVEELDDKLNNLGNKSDDGLDIWAKSAENLKEEFADVIEYAVDAEKAFEEFNKLYKKIETDEAFGEKNIILPKDKDYEKLLGYYTRFQQLDQNGLTGNFELSDEQIDLMDEYSASLDNCLKELLKIDAQDFTDKLGDMTAAQLKEIEKLKVAQKEVSEQPTTPDKEKQIEETTEAIDNLTQAEKEAKEQVEKLKKEFSDSLIDEEKIKELTSLLGNLSDNTKIKVDVDIQEAITNTDTIHEKIDKLPEVKDITIRVRDTDYSNTSLLSDEEGKTITAFRGVKNAWSGLVNDKGISFFTDQLELAADYADSLAESGKIYSANLSFKNPLEIDGNGAIWNEIEFDGVKRTTDEIVGLAKQLGHDGVIFRNIRDGFGEANGELSNVMVTLNEAQIKNEQVVAAVKANTGKMIPIENQQKLQTELEQTKQQAKETTTALSEINQSSVLSGIEDSEKLEKDLTTIYGLIEKIQGEHGLKEDGIFDTGLYSEEDLQGLISLLKEYDSVLGRIGDYDELAKSKYFKSSYFNEYMEGVEPNSDAWNNNIVDIEESQGHAIATLAGNITDILDDATPVIREKLEKMFELNPNVLRQHFEDYGGIIRDVLGSDEYYNWEDKLFPPHQTEVLSGGESKIYDGLEQVSEDQYRLTTDIGLSHDELIAKIKEETKAIEEGNVAFKERWTYLDKQGKVIDSYMGTENEVRPGNVSGAYKVVHTHPSSEDYGGNFSSDDMFNLVLHELDKGVKEIELVWRDKIVNLDFSSMSRESIEKFVDQYEALKTTLMTHFNDESEGGMFKNLNEQLKNSEYTISIMQKLISDLGGNVTSNQDLIGIDEAELSNILVLFKQIEHIVSQVKEDTTPEQFAKLEEELLGIQRAYKVNQTPLSSENEVVKSQNKIQEELKETKKYAIELTNEFGEVIEVYRGIRNMVGDGRTSNRYHGGTFWTSHKGLAQEYGDKLTHATISMDNPFIYRGDSEEWDNLVLYNKELEDLSKYITNLEQKANELLIKMQSIGNSTNNFMPQFDFLEGDIVNVKSDTIETIKSLQEFQEAFYDIKIEDFNLPQFKNYILQLYDIFQSIARLSELADKNNLNTNEIVEIAKALNYDGVVFTNISDPIPADIFVTFEKEQVHIIDTISSAQLKLEEEQRLVNEFVDTRRNLYETIKSLNEEQLDSYITNATIEFQSAGTVVSNLLEVFYKQNPTDTFQNIKNAVKDYLNEIVKEFDELSDLSTPIKDTFDTTPETTSMEEVVTATDKAIESKKDFATANEGVQASVDGSKSKLELEAELMESIAKNARDAAEAKKDFVKANEGVEKSANQSSDALDKETSSLKSGHSEISEPSGVKKYKKKGYKAHDTGNHDNEVKVTDKAKLGKVLKELQGEIIASIDESTQFVKEVTDFYDSADNLVKTQMKIGDKTGGMKTYTTSYSTDKDGNDTAWTSHITTQKYTEEEKAAKKLVETKRKLRQEEKQTAQSTVDKALKDQLTAWKEIQKVRVKIAKTDPNNVDEINNLKVIKKEHQQRYIDAGRILKANESLYNKESQLAKLELERSKTTKEITEHFERINKNLSPTDRNNKKAKKINDLIPNKKVDRIISLAKNNKLDTSEYEELQKTINDVINLQGEFTKEVGASEESFEKLKEASNNFKEGFFNDLKINKGNVYESFSQTFANITKRKNFSKNDIGIVNTVREGLKTLDSFKLSGDTIEDGNKLLGIINEISTGLKQIKAIPYENLLPDASEISKDLGNINKVLNGGYKIPQKLKQEFKELQIAYQNAFNSDGSVKIVNKEFQDLHNTLAKLNAEFEATGKKKSLFGSFSQRLTDMNTKFLAQYLSFQDIIRYGRQAFETIKEYDTALTEMNKVSEESIHILKEFQKESFELADSVGTTASQIQNSTADWMRLGYSLESAAKLAKDANIYANVGDMGIDEATEHMISSVQAWKSEFSSEIEASEAIVDRYNEIGKIMPPYIVIYR